MGIVQNCVIFVTDILDCGKDTTMKLGAQVSRKMLWDLPGTCAIIYMYSVWIKLVTFFCDLELINKCSFSFSLLFMINAYSMAFLK